jgi:hypothetical protein
MDDYCRALADAWIEAFDRGRGTNHTDRFPGPALTVVLTTLAGELSGRPPGDVKGRVTTLLAAEKIPKPAQWVKELFTHLPVYVGEDTTARITCRTDLPNQAMFSGEELLATQDPATIRRKVAHNYLLRYPEALPLLEEFRLPGAPSTVLSRWSDEFVAVRRLNDTNTDYLFKEFKALGLIEEADQQWRLDSWQPAPAVAYYAVEAYLEFGGFRTPPPQVPRDDVENRLRLVCRSARIDGPWGAELRFGSGPFFRLENTGADLRADPADIVWMTRVGLVSAETVGRILRTAGACADLQRLHERAHEALTGYKNKARNQDQFLAYFDPPVR